MNEWDMLSSTVRASLHTKPVQTDTELVERMRRFAVACGCDESAPEFEELLRTLRHEDNILIDPGESIESNVPWVKWLQDARESQISCDIRWRAYMEYLSNDLHRPQNVIYQLNRTSDEVLNLISDPRRDKEPRQRKGLILGDVQSGKTQTYMSLMNKAADYGYKLLVVLTSDNEDLRRQTQKRIDTDFFGYLDDPNTGNHIKSGIGKHFTEEIRATGLTDSTMDFLDFRKKSLNRIARPGWVQTPSVAVIKKNSRVLNSFIECLSNEEFDRTVPVLLIDDECDYASVNTSKDSDSPTTINKLIRELFSISSRTAYVAVTATPFANIFIDDQNENDLFPEDFIYVTHAPKNYIGVDELFGNLDEPNNHNPRIKEIDEDDLSTWLGLKQKKDEPLRGPLHRQVRYAIDTFAIACAIADAGDSRHQSMLVHVSRYTPIQRMVADQIYEHLSNLRNAVQMHRNDETDPIITELRDVYEHEYHGVLESNWSSVLNRLVRYLPNTVVRLVNATNEAEVWNEYHNASEEDESDCTIYVGGDKLSRGMTLEGLTVSFFYRNTSAADTLLQMGRWFGYRDGYDELTRIWLLPQAIDDFQYASSVLIDLKKSISIMKSNGMTPKDFGLAIQKNPSKGVRITNPTKMRSAVEHDHKVLNLSLAGRRVESTILSYDPHVLKKNDEALQILLYRLDASTSYEEVRSTKKAIGVCYECINASMVLDFLSTFRAGYKDLFFGDYFATYGATERKLPFSLAERYVETQAPDGNKSDSLGQCLGNYPYWDVMFVTGGEGDPSPCKAKFTWNMNKRTCKLSDREQKTFAVSGSSRRLGSTNDVRAYVARFGNCPSGYRSDNELDYYQYAARPAMLIYMLQPEEKFDAPDHAVAVKLVIPQEPDQVDTSDAGKGTIYYYNTVAERQQFLDAISKFGELPEEE